MSRRLLPAHVRAFVQAAAERSLSPEEVKATLAVPIGDEERAEVLSLVRWFRRRYPSPLDRLAYVRRAYLRWAAHASLPENP